jgi:uncharacterized protein YifN (PemK superfamily)
VDILQNNTVIYRKHVLLWEQCFIYGATIRLGYVASFWDGKVNMELLTNEKKVVVAKSKYCPGTSLCLPMKTTKIQNLNNLFWAEVRRQSSEV